MNVKATAAVGRLLAARLLPSAFATCCLSSVALGQYPGDKVIYSDTHGDTTEEHDYIDASIYSTDVCTAILKGLEQLFNSSYLYNTKGVVDARGIVPGSNQVFSCNSNPWPAGGSSNYSGVSATVLLPAGIIPISSSWVLPPNTILVGGGSGTNPVPTNGNGITTLQAASGFTGDMIDMGNPQTQKTFCIPPPPAILPDCNGIVIRHLRLDVNNTGANGIYNGSGQELNYVNDVSIINLNAGVGLTITGENDANVQPAAADNSGPYSALYISGNGLCANINGTYGTRGIHGLTCHGTQSPTTAIKLDGTNNTIEDVFITGYTTDGIEIGSQGNYAQDNLISNVTGDTTVAHVVHIVNSSGGAPTDLTLIGISSLASSGTYTVYDDVAGFQLTDQTVAIYILGESMPGTSGYSHFTTSNSAPAWFVGPQPTTNEACATNGSLYSVTSVSSGDTLFACIGKTWVGIE